MTDVPVETLGAILIAGDTAYGYYNFSQSAADMYTAAVNRLHPSWPARRMYTI